MTPLHKAIADDLENKLRSDLARAVKHYAEMASIAELPPDELQLTIMETAVRFAVSLAQNLNMPEDVLLAATSEMWKIEGKIEKGGRK